VVVPDGVAALVGATVGVFVGMEEPGVTVA
jgi:hypothetical protein